MDESALYHVTLTDGTEFEAISDGAGNLITEAEVTSEMFQKENLKTVTIREDDNEPYVLHDQVNRTFMTYGEGKIMIRLDDKTIMEKLQDENTALREANDMLTECILEMSEIIYGE